MKTSARSHGFTMAEMMIAMAGSVIIIGALLYSSMGLQKAFHSSEVYAAAQADQRRLLDYLTRDLRRAVGVATTTQLAAVGAGTKVGTDPVMLDNGLALLLSLPGYYKSNTPANPDFDEVLPIVIDNHRADYGTSDGAAPAVSVLFRKAFIAEEGCVCFVRQEGDAQTIIVRKAEDLATRITISPDGTSCLVEVWFTSPFGSTRPLIAAHDQIMLRNNRID